MGCSEGWVGTDRNSTALRRTEQSATQTDAVLFNAQGDFAAKKPSQFQRLTSVKEICAS